MYIINNRVILYLSNQCYSLGIRKCADRQLVMVFENTLIIKRKTTKKLYILRCGNGKSYLKRFKTCVHYM